MKKNFLMLVLSCLLLFSCNSNHSDVAEGFKESDQVIRIGIADDPHTLDPRAARNLETATFLHMLYEGLFRLNFHGKPEYAIAESYTLSPDHKTYTFKLRKSMWSNGEALTAHHFVDTWKAILNPSFAAPNAYQFYMIKGAKTAKEGKTSADEIGIKALDDATLVVELESPCPYFLELLATHFFYPFHLKSSPDSPIVNGPFQVRRWKKQNEFVAVRNPRYWEANEVRLDGIVALVLDEQTALRMFEKKELDWAGSPLSTLPQDSISSLKHHHKLQISSGAGTFWFRFNTEKPPFNNVKMRKAFTLAIDRKSIVEHITQGGQTPAEAIVPSSFGLKMHSYFVDQGHT